MALPSCCSHWRQWLKPIAVVLYILLLCITVPLCIWELHNRKAKTHTQEINLIKSMMQILTEITS